RVRFREDGAMTRARAIVLASLAFSIVVQANLHAQVDLSRRSAEGAKAERHHYTIGARVRPLVVFWISRSGVGDAVVTRRRAPGEASYSLLIGSDPDRAPLHINRWGYIEEEISGADATLLGLMTESEEDAIQHAEA